MHRGLAVEQEARVRRRRAPAGRAARRAGATSSDPERLERCVPLAVPVRVGTRRPTSEWRHTWSAYGAAPRARHRAAWPYARRCGRSTWRAPRCSSTSTAPSATADVGVHLLERLAPAEWREISRAVRPRARSAAVSASSTSGSCCRGRRGDAPRRSPPRCRSTPASSRSSTRCARAGAEVTVVSDGFGVLRRRGLRARSASTCSRTRVDFATGRAGVPARGPVLPVLVLRHVQAGADQGRAPPRADDGARSATARATARPRCSPTWCSPRVRSLPGASAAASPFHRFERLADVHVGLTSSIAT